MNRSIVFLLFGYLPVAFCAADGPTFDAASVKIAGPETRPPYIVSGGPGTDDPGRFRGPHMSMTAMLSTAFGVSIDQIQGPKWLSDLTAQPYYNIDAIMPPHATKEQFQRMFQNLLIERFHLVFHHETRNFPGYELVVDAGGPKIKEVTPDPNSGTPTMQAMTQAPKGDDGFPTIRGSFKMNQFDRSGKIRTKYQEWSLAEFVSNLGFMIGSSRGKGVLEGSLQPRVVDRTGLTGKYTFVVEYYDAGVASSITGLRMADGLGADVHESPSPTASDPAGATSIFTAIQKQLGLRLDKTSGVPLDVIIVDSVGKTPTEN